MSNERESGETSGGGRWKSLKSLFRREKKVSILVDGPNLLRRLGNRQIKIEDIDEVAEKLGSIVDRYVYLNHHASEKLIEATSITSPLECPVLKGLHQVDTSLMDCIRSSQMQRG